MVLADSLIPSVKERSGLLSHRQVVQFKSLLNVTENCFYRIMCTNLSNETWLGRVKHVDYRHTFNIKCSESLDYGLHVIVDPV